jgi:hypothetical protein
MNSKKKKAPAAQNLIDSLLDELPILSKKFSSKSDKNQEAHARPTQGMRRGPAQLEINPNLEVDNEIVLENGEAMIVRDDSVVEMQASSKKPKYPDVPTKIPTSIHAPKPGLLSRDNGLVDTSDPDLETADIFDGDLGGSTRSVSEFELEQARMKQSSLEDTQTIARPKASQRAKLETQEFIYQAGDLQEQSEIKKSHSHAPPFPDENSVQDSRHIEFDLDEIVLPAVPVVHQSNQINAHVESEAAPVTDARLTKTPEHELTAAYDLRLETVAELAPEPETDSEHEPAAQPFIVAEAEKPAAAKSTSAQPAAEQPTAEKPVAAVEAVVAAVVAAAPVASPKLASPSPSPSSSHDSDPEGWERTVPLLRAQLEDAERELGRELDSPTAGGHNGKAATSTQDASVQGPLETIDRMMLTEIRPSSAKAREAAQKNPLPAAKARVASGAIPTFSSAEASLKQSESLRIAQFRISELEHELDRIRRENEKLSSAGETLRRHSEELRSRAENIEQDKRESERILEEEKRVMRGQLMQKERENIEFRQRLEETEGRLESNFKKIRVRERELEHRLEIVKMESATLVSTKDKMILDLKRQVDQLNSESDYSKQKAQEMQGQYKEKQETIRRVVRALRIALTILEGDEQNVVPFKKAE